MTLFSCVIVDEFPVFEKTIRKRWSPFAHWHSPFAHWHSSLFTNGSRINIPIRAKSEKGLLSAIPMRALLCNRVPVRKQELLSAIPMRALVCDRIPVQKQVRLHARNAPKVRNNTIPLRALEANLCVPFYNAENEKFVFCRFANWKKTSPRQCAQRDQSDQNRSFRRNALMGFRKKCAYGYHNARIKVVRI